MTEHLAFLVQQCHQTLLSNFYASATSSGWKNWCLKVRPLFYFLYIKKRYPVLARCTSNSFHHKPSFDICIKENVILLLLQPGLKDNFLWPGFGSWSHLGEMGRKERQWKSEGSALTRALVLARSDVRHRQATGSICALANTTTAASKEPSSSYIHACIQSSSSDLRVQHTHVEGGMNNRRE